MILPLYVEPQHARATLLTEVSQAAAGKPFLAAVQITTDPHWHVYWRNPGDSGIPTKIEWKAPKGWKVEPLELPTPKRFAPGGITGFGYEGKTLFLARITPTTSRTMAVSLSANVKWLVCNDACIPGSGKPSMTIKMGDRAKQGGKAAELRSALAKLPRPASAGWKLRAFQGAKTVTFEATPPAGSRLPSGTAAFFPFESGIVDHAKSATATLERGKLVLMMSVSPFPEERSSLSGLLVSAPGTTWPGGQRALVVEARLEKGDPR